MANCDNNNDMYAMNALRKRREALAAIVNYHKNNFHRTRTSFQELEDNKYNSSDRQSTEPITSDLLNDDCNPLDPSNLSKNSDIIEDSEEENFIKDYKTKTSITSSTDDEVNTSTFSLPRAHAFFGSTESIDVLPQSQKNKVAVTSNPNKKIQLLSSTIIKKSHEDDYSMQLPLQQSPISPTVVVSDDVMISTPETTNQELDYNITNLPLQQSSISPSVVVADDVMISTPEMTNQKLDYNIKNLPLQQSPISPTIVVADDVMISTPETTNQERDYNIKNLPLQQSSISPTIVVADDVMISTPETTNQKLDYNITNLPLQQSPISPTVVVADERNKNKGRKRRNPVNSYMDFLSDEDNLDYSSGSSNIWSRKETESSTEEEIDTRKRKVKKLKKNSHVEIKKKEKPQNKRKIVKKLKEDGKSYENRSGKIVLDKEMKPNPCIKGKCSRGCYDILEERRQSLFAHFWSLDSQRRRDWLVRCCRLVPIKRRKKTDSLCLRRNASYEYYINNGEDHQKVCQKFLINTLNITQKYLTYTMSRAIENTAQIDKRKPNAPERYTDAAKLKVKQFIESLPAVPSHYNRQRTNRVYLPQELKNVSNLYQIYKKSINNDQDIVTENMFRNMFNEYNISFHVPKKDKCVTCTRAEHNMDTMTEKDKEKLDYHIKEKKASYRRFKKHQCLKSIDNETITCSFDLQKVLGTPHGQSMLLYYSRKYAVYNLTFYESGTQEVYCFNWGESDGKRGSNEIASCLLKYLEEKDKIGTKNIILYCDSCSGQNKNKTILTTINYFLKFANNIEVIQINYLLPGHTYMPVDSVHATIEREVQKLIVWSPSQWPTYFETARKRPKPYKVIVMDHTDFQNFDQLTANTFTPYTMKNIKVKQIRIATFKKKYENQIFVKYSMAEEAEAQTITLMEKPSVKRKVKGKGKGKGKAKDKSSENKKQEAEEVKPLYATKLNINKQKYMDLTRLCDNGTIPKRFHEEYRKLTWSSVVDDALNETDEEDNEEENNTKDD